MKDQIMRAAEFDESCISDVAFLEFNKKLYIPNSFEKAIVRAENARLRPLIEKLAERLEASQKALKEYSGLIARKTSKGVVIQDRMATLKWDSKFLDLSKIARDAHDANAAFLKDLTK